MSLGKVSIAIEAAMAGFESDMGRAQRLLEKETKRMERDLESMRGKAKMVGAAIGAGIVAGLAIVATATKRAIDEMDELGETAQKVGLPTEELSALAYAASFGAVNTETLSSSLVKLTKNASDARQGVGEAQKGFKALGIDVQNADGSMKSSGDLLTEIAGKFAKYRDGAEKTALAVNLFGKSGAELIPLLNLGAEGIENLKQEAEDLGLTFDDVTANRAGAFNDQLDKIRGIAKGLWQQIASQLLPVLVNLTERFFNSAKGAETLGKFVTTAVTGIKLLTSVGVVVVGVFKTLGEALGGVAAALVQLLSGEFKGALQTVKDYQVDVVKNIAGTIGTVKDIWDDSAAEIEASAPATSEAIAAPVLEAEEKVKKSGKRIVDEAARIYKQVEDKIAQIRRDIDTFGMTGDQVEIFDLAKAGATPDQLARAADAQATRALLNADKDLYDARMKADADQARGLLDVTSGLTEEIELLRLSSDEQERYLALKQAGVDALSREGQAITDLVGKMQDARRARYWMDELNDSFFDLFTGVLDFSKGAEAAFDDFLKSLQQMAIRFLADESLRKLQEWLGNIGQAGGNAGAGAAGSGGGFWSSVIGAVAGLFGGGRANGGPTRAGRFYEVLEKGEPELLSVGGRMLLMAGDRDGHVTPLDGAARAGGSINQENHFHYAAPTSTRTQAQTAARVGYELRRAQRLGT